MSYAYAPKVELEAPEPEVSAREVVALRKELAEARFEAMFERVLTEMTQGRTLKGIVQDDLRDVQYEKFWAWIRRDPKRMDRYKEAKEIRTEWWAGRILEIAEADDTDDVMRSKLRIDTYKWLMSADNRKTYGESKQIEVNSTISITAALEQAQSRLAALEVVDMETDTPRLEGEG